MCVMLSMCCRPELQNKNMPDGMIGVQRRFVMFGGGVSEQQLEWLEQELQVNSFWVCTQHQHQTCLGLAVVP